MDEFDHALMEALNEAVPPADFKTNLADRLVARAHRRTRLWKLFLAFFAVSAAFGTVWTASELSGNDMDADDEMPSLAADVSRPGDSASAVLADPNPEPITSSTTGDTEVTTPHLKSTAALAGALALSAAQPAATRAAPALTASGDGYQYIVSGYPAANPSRSARSASTGLDTGAYHIVSASDAMEARYRTCIASNATALRSDEFRAMIIIFK